MSFLDKEALGAVRAAPPGLQLAAWLDHVAETLSEEARALLSYVVSGLVSRGWVSSASSVLDAAVEAVGEDRAKLTRALDELQSAGMVQIEDDKFITLAAVLCTNRTSIAYFMDEDHRVYLTGPMAALAVARGLGRSGEIMADCTGSEPARRVRLVCDETGIHTRDPDTIALFLPHWSGDTHPVDAMGGGGIFVDDGALAAWQEAHADVDGLPLSSFMFPMAATDLGARTGKALEGVLDRFGAYA